uniref:Uncharacterized protein n=1 Tax=Anguilla anguilla TaxID=7936 RepID=A0A0E9VF00_ANGAN
MMKYNSFVSHKEIMRMQTYSIPKLLLINCGWALH